MKVHGSSTDPAVFALIKETPKYVFCTPTGTAVNAADCCEVLRGLCTLLFGLGDILAMTLVGIAVLEGLNECHNFR